MRNNPWIFVPLNGASHCDMSSKRVGASANCPAVKKESPRLSVIPSVSRPDCENATFTNALGCSDGADKIVDVEVIFGKYVARAVLNAAALLIWKK